MTNNSPEALEVVPFPQVGQIAPSELLASADRANKFVEDWKNPRTERAYASDWRHFTAWCAARNLLSLPAEPGTVGMYLFDMVEVAEQGRAQKVPRTPATFLRRLAAISRKHRDQGFDSPCALRHQAVKSILTGFKKKVGIKQVQKEAATSDVLKRMLTHVPATLSGARDRALLLLGFAAALRRSELVALRVEDVSYQPDGLLLTIRKSKTDQEGAGETIAVHYGRNVDTCPVRSLQAWLAQAGIVSGPLFRGFSPKGSLLPQALSDRIIASRIKRYAKAAGYDAKGFSGHSLRAGLATAAAIAGASERKIQDQTRHKSPQMVRRYIREANLFRDNVSGCVGL